MRTGLAGRTAASMCAADGGKGRRPDVAGEVVLLVRSQYGLVVLDGDDHERTTQIVEEVATRLGLPRFVWTVARGLRRAGAASGVYGTGQPLQAIAHVASARVDALYHFDGFGEALEDRRVVERLCELERLFRGRRGAVLLTGIEERLPDRLREVSARVRVPPPDLAAYRDLLLRVVRRIAASRPVRVEIGRDDVWRLLHNLRGLTLAEAERLLTRVIVEDGDLSAKDVRKIIAAKRERIAQEGLLDLMPPDAGMVDVADLAGLKRWLRQRAIVVTRPDEARARRLPFPKGVLLLGVPGTGKSLCAKAVAHEWGLPLLRLEPARLYDKYVGATERNFDRALRLAERMAPAILWIDEIEKAFAGLHGSEDGGVTARVLGSFLSWMQERRADVFVVATANDVSRLPPELLRKGRFDEIFFLDVPDRATREELFRIHLAARGLDPARFDVGQLADASDGFTGAEIAQCVAAALYAQAERSGVLGTADLVAELRRTVPIVRAMPERIAALRAWARDRTVPAG